jgi:phenylacetate-CoA ligase
MYSWLTPLVFNAHEHLTGRRYWRQTHELLSIQWKSPEALRDRVLVKFQRLLYHAYEHVPYYQNLLQQAGLHPGDVRSLDDLASFPITTKRDLRTNFPDRVVADNLPQGRRSHQKTSGSMGMPLEFYRDRNTEDVWRASKYFFRTLAGIKPADSHIIITTPQQPWSWFQERLRRLLTGSTTHYLSAAETTLDSFGEAVHGLRAYYLQGIASYVARLARELERQEVGLEVYPKAVFADSETLTSLEAAQINRGFHCPLFLHYTSVESQNMALSCPDNPKVMHVNTESVLVEIVTHTGHAATPGERGRVIITDLNNYVMPFLRYEIGDTAVAGDRCACGRGFPTIESLEGRTSEYIRTPGGRIIMPSFLGSALFVRSDFLSRVLEYQAVQTDLDRILLKIVPSQSFDQDTRTALRSCLRELLDNEMHVDLELVDHIAKEASGKRLIIKSQVAEGGNSP